MLKHVDVDVDDDDDGDDNLNLRWLPGLWPAIATLARTSAPQHQCFFKEAYPLS